MQFHKYISITICSFVTGALLMPDWTFGVIIWSFLWALDTIIESQIRHIKTR